jgi:hypothetical protein
MIFLVFLFNLILCTFLIFYYTKNIEISDDICLDNKVNYYKILRYLLYIYLTMYLTLIILYMTATNLNVTNYSNILLIIFGFITVCFTFLIYVKIYPKSIKCFMNVLTYYISLLPLLLLGLISIFLGYLGGVIEKCKVIN